MAPEDNPADDGYELGLCIAEINDLKGQLAARQAFKDWVHNWLTTHGVPEDPDPEHREKSGCRIGGRLEWLYAQIAAAVAAETARCAKVASTVGDELMEQADDEDDREEAGLAEHDQDRASTAYYIGRRIAGTETAPPPLQAVELSESEIGQLKCLGDDKYRLVFGADDGTLQRLVDRGLIARHGVKKDEYRLTRAGVKARDAEGGAA